MNRDDAEEYTQAAGQVNSGGWRFIALGERLGVPQALGISTDEWVNGRLGGYIRLSIPERREAVAELAEEGMPTRKIGDVLGVDHSTVVRDRKSLGAGAPPKPDDVAPEADDKMVPGANAPPEPEIVDIRDTDLGREAAETPSVRQLAGAQTFSKAVVVTTELGPQIDHVVASARAIDDRALDSARNCLRIWERIVEQLDETQPLRRVK